MGPNSRKEFSFGTLQFVCKRPSQRYLPPIAVDCFPFFCLAEVLVRRKGLYAKARGHWMFEVLFSRSG